MLMGLAVALGPLAWVWLRNKHAPAAQRLRVLTLVTLFLTFDLVVFGAFTRLTDSGLGCPDWPGCYGSASPLGAQVHIDAAQSAMPTGPVTHPKALRCWRVLVAQPYPGKRAKRDGQAHQHQAQGWR